jgi:hypothetical protein
VVSRDFEVEEVYDQPKTAQFLGRKNRLWSEILREKPIAYGKSAKKHLGAEKFTLYIFMVE